MCPFILIPGLLFCIRTYACWSVCSGLRRRITCKSDDTRLVSLPSPPPPPAAVAHAEDENDEEPDTCRWLRTPVSNLVACAREACQPVVRLPGLLHLAGRGTSGSRDWQTAQTGLQHTAVAEREIKGGITTPTRCMGSLIANFAGPTGRYWRPCACMLALVFSFLGPMDIPSLYNCALDR